jgi:3'DNA-binding domain (3'BD)
VCSFGAIGGSLTRPRGAERATEAVARLRRMSVERDEPLTIARALRGPFDHRLGERFAGVEVGTVLRVPFGPRRVLGVVVDLAERSSLAPDPSEDAAAPATAGLRPRRSRYW